MTMIEFTRHRSRAWVAVNPAFVVLVDHNHDGFVELVMTDGGTRITVSQDFAEVLRKLGEAK